MLFQKDNLCQKEGKAKTEMRWPVDIWMRNLRNHTGYGLSSHQQIKKCNWISLFMVILVNKVTTSTKLTHIEIMLSGEIND